MALGYSKDTFVRTLSGWSLVSDIKQGDILYSLALDNNTIETSSVTDVTNCKSTEDIYHFGNRYFDVLVGGDHPMMAKHKDGIRPAKTHPDGSERLVAAKDIKVSHIVQRRGVSWCGDDVDYFVLPGVYQKEQYTLREIWVDEKRIDMGDWLEFFGFYIADGCARQGLNTQGNPRYQISIKQHEQNEAYVLKLFERIGFPCKISKNKTGNHNYTVYSKQLWTYLNMFGASRDKYIPNEFLALNSELLLRLWDGYVAGDSTTTGYGSILSLSSVSEQLMIDMQDILLKTQGRQVPVLTVNTRYRDQPYQYFSLSFAIGKQSNSKYYQAMRVPYDDVLYNFAIDKNEVILIRRGGKTMWCGV